VEEETMTGTLTEKQQRLKKSLYEIFNNEDFVVGIGSTIRGDDEAQEMLDFIESNEWKDPYELTVKALLIDHNRKQD